MQSWFNKQNKLKQLFRERKLLLVSYSLYGGKWFSKEAVPCRFIDLFLLLLSHLEEIEDEKVDGDEPAEEEGEETQENGSVEEDEEPAVEEDNPEAEENSQTEDTEVNENAEEGAEEEKKEEEEEKKPKAAAKVTSKIFELDWFVGKDTKIGNKMYYSFRNVFIFNYSLKTFCLTLTRWCALGHSKRNVRIGEILKNTIIKYIVYILH